ncbi:MAG TPA: A/G-specific adenine glycosylase [Novimethylophilus sp.]|jgi:A/G-specific adenine glycosylase|uniref:A/G-specific adenine glycosylase n=1 Tax=Novimethylophilus sp. TaxID=2137426 RepID=UPI002F42C3C2
MQNFARKLIAWQQTHGRHTLPWQNTRDPYAIWVSEIMLQQTQVSAVIPYYQRFMARFPDIANLAAADQDAVLQHWSGLGYYSRARNLHRAAQLVVELHRGQFPQSVDAVQALPGIGRSTAAAIAVFAFGQQQAILDGNVKRVLTRCFGIEGWPDRPTVQKRLWALAESLLPGCAIEAYTQGLMDLGATLCTRTRPNCGDCPLREDCVALRDDRTDALPTPKPRKALPEKQTVMLLLLNGNQILLEKRPPSGIWGGLWSLPETAAIEDAQLTARQAFGLETQALPPLPMFTHTFTHFRLHITPQPLRVIKQLPEARQAGLVWLDREDALGSALPTAVRNLLQRLRP